jgi:hypothetical protein
VSGRPRFVILCDGTGEKPHKPVIVAVYARDDDGTWLPIHSATRDGKCLVMPDTGYRADAGQFDWPCRNRRCMYKFRADAGQVGSVLDRLLAAGQTSASLRLIDAALRR